MIYHLKNSTSNCRLLYNLIGKNSRVFFELINYNKQRGTKAMNQHVLAVQRMQAYIENHLSEDISLGDLSDVACYSVWHTYRIFVLYLSITPAKYIRKLRLSKAANALYDGEKITDVAFLFGFGSVDGFQRAFYKEFKINPKEFAKQHRFIKLFVPEIIKEKRGEKNMKNIKFFGLIVCFVLGIASGILLDSQLLNKQMEVEAYSGKQVAEAINSSYSSLKNSDIITNNNMEGYLVKTNDKPLNEKVDADDADAFIINEGSILYIDDSISMDFGDLAEKVFGLIGALFNQGSYDLMSTTLLLQVRDAEGITPSDFDIKMKMVGFQGGIGFEYYLTDLTNTIEIYESIYIHLDSNGNPSSVFCASKQPGMLVYGGYDITNNQTLSLNPEYAHIDRVEQEITNMYNVLKYSSATLKTGIDILSVLFS